MSTALNRKIVKEYNDYEKEAAGLNILFRVDDRNLQKWEAVLFGPDDTEWEGAVFQLKIEFPNEYPVGPPKVSFLHPRMFHPNVYVNGDICLDILNKGWTQAYNILAVMKSIQSLLVDPNTSSPANNQAAKLFDNDKAAYLRHVEACVVESWMAK